MRTEKEILERLTHKDCTDDIFGAYAGRLLDGLSYDAAVARELVGTEFMAKVAAGEAEKWAPLTDEKARAEILSYLEFAWDKANNKRGLSAGRSIAHFSALTWLIGDDDAAAFLANDNHYAPYGKPMLQYLSDRYGYTGEGDDGDHSDSE